MALKKKFVDNHSSFLFSLPFYILKWTYYSCVAVLQILNPKVIQVSFH